LSAPIGMDSAHSQQRPRDHFTGDFPRLQLGLSAEDTSNPSREPQPHFQLCGAAARTDTCRSGRQTTAVVITIPPNATANGATRPNR
jgi:hypothetical protein